MIFFRSFLQKNLPFLQNHHTGNGIYWSHKDTLEYVHALQEKNGDALPAAPSVAAASTTDTQSPLEAIDYALAQLKAELADNLLVEIMKMDEYFL